MGIVRVALELTDQEVDWISAKIEAGQFANSSECIRDLIRREQERLAEIEQVRSALEAGEASGEPAVFDAKAFKLRMIKAHG